MISAIQSILARAYLLHPEGTIESISTEILEVRKSLNEQVSLECSK
jgi:hypothetical protein